MTSLRSADDPYRGVRLRFPSTEDPDADGEGEGGGGMLFEALPDIDRVGAAIPVHVERSRGTECEPAQISVKEKRRVG